MTSKSLWLSTLLVFGSSSVAQSNSGTCKITMDRGTTVPTRIYGLPHGYLFWGITSTYNSESLVFCRAIIFSLFPY